MLQTMKTRSSLRLNTSKVKINLTNSVKFALTFHNYDLFVYGRAVLTWCPKLDLSTLFTTYFL